MALTNILGKDSLYSKQSPVHIHPALGLNGDSIVPPSKIFHISKFFCKNIFKILKNVPLILAFLFFYIPSIFRESLHTKTVPIRPILRHYDFFYFYEVFIFSQCVCPDLPHSTVHYSNYSYSV